MRISRTMLSPITTAIIIDTRRIKKNSLFPLKLRITYQRKQRYYYLGIDLTKIDWAKMNNPTIRGELRIVKMKINSIQLEAEKIIQGLNKFSFDEFERLFLEDNSTTDDVYSLFNSYILKLTHSDRIATANSYSNALESLKKYKSKLSFDQINVDFLYGYEKYMLDQQKSITTVGIYIRSLRTIYNIAIENGIISRDLYPFTKRKYQIPGGKNVKKSLTLEEIKKIYYYKARIGSNEERAKDFWLFSYLCNGMNVKDICRLKFKDLEKDRIVFHRAKTARTIRSNMQPITVMLLKDTKKIIKKWCNKDTSLENYVFPVLGNNSTPPEEFLKVKQFTKNINKGMKTIAIKLGIEKPVTTYVARHCFATVLKRSGATFELIQESLGHKNKDITESYLASFDENTKLKYTKILLSFD